MLVRSGLLRPVRPDRLLGMTLALARWGVTPATGYAAGAARHPHRPALVDDEGSLTYRQVDERTSRLAGHLLARGVRAGDPVGLLARNGRGFVEAAVALAKCGADVLYLNTGGAGEQHAEVLRREGATALVADAELRSADAPVPVLTTEELGRLAEEPAPAPGRPRHESRQVILTSGTTGAPRGAARSGGGIDDLVAALAALPLRAGEPTVIAPPLFHAWGLGHLSLAMLLGSTVVVHRRFDPAQVLRDVADHRATALVVVPVLLRRLLDAGPAGHDLSSLRVVASSGSALPPGLATEALTALGPVLYNLYGSTEVAYAAVAGPADLAEDPGCAGRPPPGVRLRVVDDEGRDVPAGEPGGIFVGSGLAFGGYTDGSDRDRLDGLVATGDLGVLDPTGRLTVVGRTDDLLVVGGENVHAGRVEQALMEHPAVQDAAVVGRPDPEWGTRLVAHVVLDTAHPAPADADLQAWVRDRLARFAVPREVVRHDALPRNATGKVVKRELA